jgi:hypothetical protein
MPMMVILHENGLVDEIACKCDGGYAQAGEGSLEAIEACKRTCGSPCLAVQTLCQTMAYIVRSPSSWNDSLPCPRIS